VVTAFVNAALNATIAWVSSAGERSVPLVSIPLFQKASTLTDTLGMLFVLPFLTTLLETASIRREQGLGRLAPLRLGPAYARWLSRLPSRPLRRAAVFGLGCLVILGPICALLLFGTDFGRIAQSTFVLYMAIFGVSLGMVVTPLIAVAAMAERTLPETQ